MSIFKISQVALVQSEDWKGPVVHAGCSGGPENEIRMQACTRVGTVGCREANGFETTSEASFSPGYEGGLLVEGLGGQGKEEDGSWVSGMESIAGKGAFSSLCF